MTVSAAALAEANKVRSSRTWYWLFEIELLTDATESRWLLLTSHDEAVTFAGRAYRPYGVKLDRIDTGAPGDLRPAGLVLTDLAGVASAFVQDYSLHGNRVVIRLVHEDLLASASDGIANVYEIQDIHPGTGVVSLELGHLRIHGLSTPAERFSRRNCPFRFASARCGVDPGSDTRGCDRTIDGPNGCSTWDNVPRFGGEPSIPGRR